MPLDNPSPVESLITDHIDIWTSAIKRKSSAGRGSNKKIELYGIKKLRELILELAVRGKLVPQDPNDEPASVLLERIAEEKKLLIKDGKIKKPKKLPEITEDEKPFELPKGWLFQKLPEVYLSISPSGKKLKTSEIILEGKFPVVDQGQEFIAGYSDAEDLLIKIDKPVLIFGDHTRNIKLIDFSFIAGADGTKILSPICIAPKYFYIHLKSYDLESRGYGRHFKILNDNLISIPPLEEQHRIVAKVDELMALCDQLEAQTESSLDAHQTLVTVLLNTLVNSQDADELAENWTRLSDHFDTLFTTEHSIDQLKQTILQLAVMGKLVEQNPNDEPASVLLERIAAEKADLIKQSKIKKQKPLPPITDDEKPFQVPKGWEWCRFDNTTLSSNAGWSPQCLPTKRVDGNWGVLKVSAVTWGKFNPEENKELPPHLEPRNEHEIHSGDFLISRANTADLVAKAVIVPPSAPTKLMMSDKIIRFKLHHHIDGEYLNLMNNSQISRDYYNRVAGGTSSSMKNVSREQIRNLLVALPPLEEQRRIVAKVDELMALCDQLKVRLNDAQTTQLQLADALTKQAL
jgi:type I restriction enzyme S subunit